MLKDLGRLVPPRVVAAVWKTMWNGWATQRRFGQSGHKCLLCCDSANSQDSIEHYARCRVTCDVAINFVGLPASHYSRWLGDFVVLGMDHHSCPEHMLVKRSVLVYAIYRTTCCLRHQPCSDVRKISDMIQQYVREAVRGHRKATSNLEMRDVDPEAG